MTWAILAGIFLVVTALCLLAGFGWGAPVYTILVTAMSLALIRSMEDET